MKIRSLRSCYARKGRTWKPKEKFNSIQEGIDKGFTRAHGWELYECNNCGKIHKSRLLTHNDYLKRKTG